MSNNDEDLSSFLMDFGFTEDELFAVTYELDSYRSIPGTTVKRYLNRILQNITEEDREAFLKGIMVGVVIRKAADSMVEPELTEEEIRVAKEIERHRFSD
jgi:2-keto-3-deoxy-galactonokinase